MSCVVDIDDIIVELAIGTVKPVAGLPPEQVAGVLSAIKTTVDQPCDVITDKGLGCYGLRVEDLQAIGVVKKGFNITNESLQCGSAFTGKYFATSAEVLLANQALQQQIMNDLLIQNMNNLRAQGIITGDETDEETAAIMAISSKESASTIDSLFDGAIGVMETIAAGFATAALVLGALGAASAVMASLKNADILGKLKGFGATIASLPELVTDTIDSADVDAEVDKLVGSTRIPSVSNPTGAVTAAAGDFSIPSIDPEDYI